MSLCITTRISQALVLQRLPWQETDNAKLVAPDHLSFLHPLQFTRQISMMTRLQGLNRNFRTDLAQDRQMIGYPPAAYSER